MLRTLTICGLLASLCACPGARAPYPAPPPRVVCLDPSLTDLIVALGAGDHLVGVPKAGRHGDVPVVGDMRPDPERVLAQRPDLVIAGDYPYLTPALDGLREQGLEVLSIPNDSLEDMRAAIALLGERLDEAPEAAALTKRLDAALAEARQAAKQRGKRPRVLLAYDVTGGHVYTTGGGDHIAEILDAAGAINVAAGSGLTRRIPLEEVVRLAPDYLIQPGPTGRFPDTAAARAFWSRLSHVPAVAAGRVWVWPDDSLVKRGPGLPGAIERLTRILDGSEHP